MKKFKTGVLATIAGLLTISAILCLILSIIYTINGSTSAVVYGLIAIPAAIGGKALFWYTEYN